MLPVKVRRRAFLREGLHRADLQRVDLQRVRNQIDDFGGAIWQPTDSTRQVNEAKATGKDFYQLNYTANPDHRCGHGSVEASAEIPVLDPVGSRIDFALRRLDDGHFRIAQ